MSTLNTTNITNGTDSITVEGAVKGSAKAWVNFNGTGTVAIRASYNVSSITDNGVGTYVINFTTAMPDANFTAVAGASPSATANVIASVNSNNSSLASSTTTLPLNIYARSDGNNQDSLYVHIAVFR